MASVVAKYAARASVALPFMIALIAGTLAVTFMLSERFGAITALWLVAGGFTFIGIVATLVVATTEISQDGDDVETGAVSDTAGTASEVFDSTTVQVPLMLLGDVMTAVGGPTTALSVVRLVGRNLPLVVMASVVCLLLMPSRTKLEGSDGE